MDAALTKNSKMTPLYKAALNGNLELVKLFVEKCKVSPSQITKLGETPLIAAIKKDRVEIIRYLLEAGADAGFTTPAGVSTI